MEEGDGIGIETIDAPGALSDEDIRSLTSLLRDSIDGGYSIGFLHSSSDDELRDFWQNESSKLRGESFLLLARVDGEVAGCVIITREARANGRHRAEFRKLMVHSVHQRKGIGIALERKASEEAKRRGVTLLYLDSATAFLVESVYESWGWIRVGSIPGYATNPDGTLVATTYFYKQL